jgi:type IV secretory pathway VirB4 component
VKANRSAQPVLPGAEQGNLNFLYLFAKVLIEASGKYELTAQDEKGLYAGVERMYKLEPDSRTLTNFASMLGLLGERLHRWTRAGQFGYVFDNVQDSLTFSRFQAFNFDGMQQYPDVLEPLLFYVLHRASNQIEGAALTATFKAFILDEAWIFLRNRTIRDYITRAEKTWRKKNAAMVLATQSAHELVQADMLAVVNECCATKIFLANPSIDHRLYAEIFHLNDTELDLLASLVPKRDVLIKQHAGSKKARLKVDSLSYWMATNNPKCASANTSTGMERARGFRASQKSFPLFHSANKTGGVLNRPAFLAAFLAGASLQSRILAKGSEHLQDSRPRSAVRCLDER